LDYYIEITSFIFYIFYYATSPSVGAGEYIAGFIAVFRSMFKDKPLFPSSPEKRGGRLKNRKNDL